MNEEMIQFGERLKEVRKRLGHNQKAMGKLLGVNQSTYAQKERGNSTITYDMFMYYFKELDININWLLSGEGDMYRNPSEVMEPSVEYQLYSRVSLLEKRYKELEDKMKDL